MSETPRTDALEFEAAKDISDKWERGEVTVHVVDSDDVRDMERELTAANAKIAELERERIIKQTHIENLNDHITNLTAKLMELEREKANLKWWATAQAVHEEHESLTAKLAAAERLAQQNGDAWGACKATINELHKKLAEVEQREMELRLILHKACAYVEDALDTCTSDESSAAVHELLERIDAALDAQEAK